MLRPHVPSWSSRFRWRVTRPPSAGESFVRTVPADSPRSRPRHGARPDDGSPDARFRDTPRARGASAGRGFSLRLSSWLPVRPGARLVREAGSQTLFATSSTTMRRPRSSCPACRPAAGPRPSEAARAAAARGGAGVPDEVAAAAREAGAVRGRGPGGPGRAGRRGPARTPRRGPAAGQAEVAGPEAVPDVRGKRGAAPPETESGPLRKSGALRPRTP